MSKSINKVILVGNLGGDPEVRISHDDKKTASFSLATSEKWRDKESDEKREKTEWHRVVIFNQALVEVAEKYLSKGDKVYVEGSMHYRQWTDSDHKTHLISEVVLQNYGSNLSILSSKIKGSNSLGSEFDA
jgi:single-strand DNA-binding protein